jgi:hypothetical protein
MAGLWDAIRASAEQGGTPVNASSSERAQVPAP